MNTKEAAIAIESAQLIERASNQFHALKQEIAKVIVGQEQVTDFISLAILCDGHILLEGVPGVAKTTMIKTASKALGTSFKRIQFTPDLLPSDLIGSLVYNAKTHDFETKKGPIFSNLVLADEINRAPAKVQSALLEAMEERQITIGQTTFRLEPPFLVFATQNPIEQEGTYRLPEAQVDRFMFKLFVDYPTAEQECEILERKNNPSVISNVLSKEQIFSAQKSVSTIHIDKRIVKYIVDLVSATRRPAEYQLSNLNLLIECGASPRATLALHKASQAHAFLRGRTFVTPDDIKVVAPPILRHRISLSYHADADRITSDAIITEILSTLPSP